VIPEDLDETAIEQIPFAESLRGSRVDNAADPVGKDIPDFDALSRVNPLDLVDAQHGAGITLQDLTLQRGELVLPALQVEFRKGFVVLVGDEVQRVPREKLRELFLALEIVVKLVFVFAVHAAPLEILVKGELVFLVEPVGIGKTGKPIVEIGNDLPAAGEIEVDDLGCPVLGRAALPGGRAAAINR
jgi:hypothetical protein